MSIKQIKTLSDRQPDSDKSGSISQKILADKAELCNEYARIIANDLLTIMLKKGLISREEFNKIEAKNRESFPSYRALLMDSLT